MRFLFWLIPCILLISACGPTNTRDMAAISEQVIDNVPQKGTVIKRYDGKPTIPARHMIDLEKTSWGETLVYDSDLGEMTLLMKKGTRRRVTTHIIPYAMCLDFINENLGSTDKGWKIIQIKCTQSGLGKEY